MDLRNMADNFRELIGNLLGQSGKSDGFKVPNLETSAW